MPPKDFFDLPLTQKLDALVPCFQVGLRKKLSSHPFHGVTHHVTRKFDDDPGETIIRPGVMLAVDGQDLDNDPALDPIIVV
jgi:hypothetical protein